MTWPNRASSGPARRIDARIREHSTGSSGLVRTPRVSTSSVFSPVQLAVAPEIEQDVEHRLHVADARHIVDPHRAIGKDRSGDHGKGGVLVASRANGAAQRLATGHNESWCHGAKLVVTTAGRKRPTAKGVNFRVTSGRGSAGQCLNG